MTPETRPARVPFTKAHAYGNDFLIVRTEALPPAMDRVSLARRICDRHRGVGADGLLIVDEQPSAAVMDLWNADGSPSELSGNGVRCVGVWLAHAQRLEVGADILVHTGAGTKTLTRLVGPEDRARGRMTFRTAMGQPQHLQTATLVVAGESVQVVTLRIGNPQCVILGPATPARLVALAGPLAVHPHFPEGTNVELAEVERPDCVRILIWERGVGPTESSGTGTCAAAVAAAAFGGARRELDVVAPGGTQRVIWTDAGLDLIGWAAVVAEGEWIADRTS